MASQIRVVKVDRFSGKVSRVEITTETIEASPVLRYRVVFKPDTKNGKSYPKVVLKYLYDDRGVNVIDDNPSIPDNIFNMMVRRAAAIMFERRKK